MRALLVGGGRAGLALTRELTAEGHAVRFVTRTEERRAAIEEAGGECWIGTPDRIGSLRYALDNVTVLLWLLGPVGDGDLHGSRLTMMLERTIDTTVRGIVYERGTDAGAELTRRMAEYNGIPHAVIDAADPDWQVSARTAADGLLRR